MTQQEDEIRPLKGAPRYIRLSLSWLVLLPLSVVMVCALLLQLNQDSTQIWKPDFWLEESVWFTLLGAGTFTALTISRIAATIQSYVYVLGHELTHALAALTCGGRVSRISVSAEGGFVDTNVDNIYVSLSPYCVPLWMGLWMLGVWLANWFFPFPQWKAWFYAGFGFWWCFHLYWTAKNIISIEQPDMKENGLVFSLMITLILNIIILLVVLCCFGVITPAGYAQSLCSAALQIWECACALYGWLVELATR